MKFTPRPITGNVNITPVSPLRELFVLLGAIVGILVVIYLVLGFALDILVERMPEKLEHKIGKLFAGTYKLQQEGSPAEVRVQKLLDALTEKIDDKELHLTVHIADNPEVNAMALPGGRIMVYSGLLKEIESENELSMILAHEIGHFMHRDHLRGLGRGLVLAAISSALFGVDNGVSEFTQRMLTTTDLKFSRQQEVAADKYGIELLNKRYGHIGGACDFFERLKDKKKEKRFYRFLSTHPAPLDRIDMLKKEIREKGYLEKRTKTIDRFSNQSENCPPAELEESDRGQFSERNEKRS